MLLEFSKYFMILIISLISSLEINKIKYVSALTAHVPLICQIYLLQFEAKLLTNSGKLSLAKGIAIFVSDFIPKLPNQEPREPSDWIILDIWALLSFMSVDIS